MTYQTDGLSHRIVHSSEQAVVIDGLLQEKELALLRDFSLQIQYEVVRVNPGLTREPTIHDNNALRGQSSLYAIEGNEVKCLPRTDPSHTSPFDIFASKLVQVIHQGKDVISGFGRPPSSFGVTPWIYPPSAGMALHKDFSNSYCGGYVYWLHGRWKFHWGGYLLILSPETRWPNEQPEHRLSLVRNFLKDDLEGDCLWDPGLALCVFPKPNRLVLMGNTCPHMVSKVDANCDMPGRISLNGFFSSSLPAL